MTLHRKDGPSYGNPVVVRWNLHLSTTGIESSRDPALARETDETFSLYHT